MKVRGLVLEYYLLLRSVLRSKPHLRRCRRRCRHCRIFFLSDPRNAGRADMRGVGRKDLGCPFGCRQAHRKRESTRRSVAYYRSEQGRKKKQTLNQRRRKCAGLQEAKKEPAAAPRVCGRWPEELVDYVRIVVSLIEGRPVDSKMILAMLAKVLRQHGMARRSRIDHIIHHLNQRPP